MDWDNERFIKLYVRDTTTWKRLGWDGQAVCMQVLRCVDRAGVLDIDDLPPWEAVMIMCGAPEENARRGIEACLRLGVLVHNDTFLLVPKFMAAQESRPTDAQRQRESRATRRDKAAITGRDGVSQIVTGGSQGVTEGHTESQAVTLGHAESQPVTLRQDKTRKEETREGSAPVQVAEVHPSQERDGRPRSLCHGWAAWLDLPHDRITSTDLHYARQIVAACDGADVDWGEVFDRWVADPWVTKTRQKLRHLDDQIHKYLKPSDSPVMSEQDRKAEVSRVGRLIGTAEHSCRLDPSDSEAKDTLEGLNKVMDRLRKMRAN